MAMATRSLTGVIRYLLLTGAVGALQATPVYAQDPTSGDETPPPESVPKTVKLGKIEVTGTRIKRADVEAGRPINIITREQIKASGLSSIGEILETLPSSGSAPNSHFNNGGTGRSNSDLRNLGPSRLLVLLDGKRVLAGISGDVDLNTLPLAIVDHLEILQDGASAVYGSDAISGVINIITVRNYNGSEAEAYLGGYDAHGDGGGWDGKNQAYDFTLGASGERSGVVMNVSYVKTAPVFAGDRTISKEPVIGAGVTGGSFLSPKGTFLILPSSGQCPGQATLTSYGTCAMTLIDSPVKHPTLGNFRNVSPNDRFNYAPANYLETPSERTSMFVSSHYDLADYLTFRAEVLYNGRRSSEQLAPDTLDLGAFGQAKSNGAPVGISGQNPYNPFHENLVADTGAACLVSGTCDLLVRLGRRFSEAGNRVFNQNVTNYQFTGGFQGYFHLLGQEWDWDATSTYAHNSEADMAGGVVNTEHLQSELGIPGQAPCAGISAVSGCTPINMFGGAGSITPKMLTYILFEQHDVVEQSLRDYTANVTGNLMDLPAGPLGMAFGAESLETDGFSHPDSLVTEGNTASSLIPPTQGRESTLAQYLEFDIPLAADAPFMKSMDLDLANRWSEFKWQGGAVGTNNLARHTDQASSGTAALRWQTNDELLLRASWAQGFRIPSIDDLFLADSGSSAQIADPCVISPLNATVAPFCGKGPYTQKNINLGINTTIGGNTRLQPERSISQTVGFVYDPYWFPGFDFSADYYKINLINAIGTVPPDLILAACYDDDLPQYCSLIRRSGGNHDAFARGEITNIQNLNANIGGIKTEGVDVNTHYKFPSTTAGDFKLGLDWTFVKQYVATLAFGTGLSSQELAGTTTASGADGTSTPGTGQVFGGIPKQRGTINLGWTYGVWSASWSVEYIGSMIEDCAQVSVINPPSRCPLTINFPFETGAVAGNHIGATVYHNVQVTYHLDRLNSDVTFGVRNLFDKEPPIAMSAFANSFLPTYYPTPGRFLFARLGVKF